MKIVRRTARSVSSTLGRDSALINALRPAYDRWLEFSSGGRGIVQTINDREQIRIDPRYRTHVPEVYDPAVCDYLREHVKPGDTCLNIGAHVGIYALLFAHWSAPDGRVFAFEPSPATRSVLEKHVAINDIGERVEVVAQAVSDAPGEATFFATELEGFSRLGQPNPDVSHEKLSKVTVPVTTVDEFCAARGLTPDWITLDIEGYEIAALSGAQETIGTASGRLRLIVEMHPELWPSTGKSREQLETLINDMNLALTCLTGQSVPLTEYGIVLLSSVEHARNTR
jgi:FkbM family methyltransferase